MTERQRVALEHTGWDTPRPGAMGFDYCPCTVHWRNETTGASGAAEPVTDLLPVQTATVTVTATVTLDGACITLQSGTATWHAA
ncbi:hypothetical protein G352_06923 [Rhodococcus ruber BKS 20-38]|uniref:Uncharacterized protein n=1 Tax=Rhodococcus ruber BKS 20-38 TaxID=1278076 RepID=M2ZZ09_9NOCA|nr:hypothetical protein [Rhodococcus ruber]EME65948.1 hypothetical protein G352_06923 [Rhodococcus ruber BKS 20-38]